MQALIAAAWQEYDSRRAQPFIVTPSIPILFFGDSQRYQRSTLHIITVGLNPSRVEFPTTSPFLRFPAALGLYPAILNGQGYTAYVQALNGYFSTEPYTAWFNSFEPILNGIGGSFYGRHQHTVLHTDLCSPLATDPTWSRLGGTDRLALQASGTNLWHDLVRYLEPDIIIVSVARGHLSSITFPTIQTYPSAHAILQRADGSTRVKPYQVEAKRVALSPNKSALLVFGEAANTPFGTVSTTDKMLIGAAILRLYEGD